MTTASLPASAGTPDIAVNRSRRRVAGVLFDFVLLLFMFVNLALAISAAGWAPGLDRLLPIAAIGVIAGTLVALSGFGYWFSRLYGLVVGAAAILFSLSQLAPEELVGQERPFHVVQRAFDWLLSVLAAQPVADSMVFVIILALVLWVLAFGAVWGYFRDGRKWQAVLPAGAALLINLYYAPPQLAAFFVVYLLCAILLLVRATLSERAAEWYDAHVHFPFDISFDFMRDGILFAIFVIMISWILPSAATRNQLDPLLDSLQTPWRQLQDEWTRLFSTTGYQGGSRVGNFGTNLALGGPRSVTDEIVMDVRSPVNRYYRAVIHDTYQSGGWVLSESEGVQLGETPLALPAFQARQTVSQTFTLYGGGGNVLLGAPQPVQTSLTADARIVPIADPGVAGGGASTRDGVSQPVEIAMLVARRPLRAGESYTILSEIAIPTEMDLRAAGTDYPDVISERYLQLPATVPPRVFDLAEEVAGDLPTPYDQAKAIETYLRSYPYNDQIPGPAPGQDGVDYFLFEERQGYCTYYASAMAIMLRHLGVPARLASGYATGELQPDGTFRVRDYDAHTWVEVYFPGFGWVEFEPTAAEPALNRPEGAPEQPTPAAGSTDSGETTPPEDDNRNIPIPDDVPDLGPTEAQTPRALLSRYGGGLLLAASVLLIIVLVIWSARRMRQPARERKRPVLRVVPQGFSARLWDKLVVWMRRLGLIAQPSYTPLEQAGVLAQRLPDGASDIQTIAMLYTRDQYSPHPITPEEASDAQASWLNLRGLMWKQWLRQRLRLPAGARRALFVRGENDEGR